MPKPIIYSIADYQFFLNKFYTELQANQRLGQAFINRLTKEQEEKISKEDNAHIFYNVVNEKQLWPFFDKYFFKPYI